MKLVTRLSLFFALMLSLALSGAGLSLWSARQADRYLEQLDLASQVYAANLQLSNHTYQLFKQFGDVLVVGRKEEADRKEELINLIREDISQLRVLISREIQFLGEVEIEELEVVSVMELQIETLFAELLSITRSEDDTNISTNWEKLSAILDGEIDEDFRALIDGAVAEELREVAETRENARKMVSRNNNLSFVFTVIAIIASVVSYFTILRILQIRLKGLTNGAREISEGRISHRVQIEGRDELASLAVTLNELADAVENREMTLRRTNENLEQKVLERTKQLEVLLDETQTTQANRKRLMADVSHELRTPLTVIRGEADVALRGDKDIEVYREALGIVRQAADHTARLVDDLLFVARNEAGETRLKIEEADLSEIVSSAASAQSTRVEILTDLTSAPLRCDPGRIRQALTVLLENARQYGGDEVLIRLDRSPDGYQLAVEDNGPGMTDAEKASAFERFFRGSNAAERYGDGAGLGLPVAKSIIDSHGGNIRLLNRPEGGLSAVVTLTKHPMLKAVS